MVDSSISNVTANIVTFNHMRLPRIPDLVHAIHQQTGDSCVSGDELYQYLRLNFGARASGWCWGRVAGLMVRTSHALLDHHHALWQYNLLAWLEKRTAPLWASALIILFLLLGIPMVKSHLD